MVKVKKTLSQKLEMKEVIGAIGIALILASTVVGAHQVLPLVLSTLGLSFLILSLKLTLNDRKSERIMRGYRDRPLA